MMKIVLIDDDKASALNIKSLLEEYYKVTLANSGKKGLEEIQKNIPDMVLCKTWLKDMNGFKIKEILNNNKKTELIPFIFLIIKEDMHEVKRIMELGADDFITAPFTSEKLLRTLERRLNKNMVSGSSKDKKNDEKSNFIFITTGKNTRFIKVSTIKCITAEGNYTMIYLEDKEKILIHKSLSEWEATLTWPNFQRIHRSTIVNLDFVESVAPYTSGSYLVFVKDIKSPFTLSQRYARTLKNKLI